MENDQVELDRLVTRGEPTIEELQGKSRRLEREAAQFARRAEAKKRRENAKNMMLLCGSVVAFVALGFVIVKRIARTGR